MFLAPEFSVIRNQNSAYIFLPELHQKYFVFQTLDTKVSATIFL